LSPAGKWVGIWYNPILRATRENTSSNCRATRGIKSLQAAIDQQGKAIKAVQEDISGVKDSLAHTNTTLKALPAKKEAKEIVDTAVDAAKSELKAGIADAKGELKHTYHPI
jgi:hypothetical protein